MADDVSVLVVDDEPYIREVCGRALKRAGYTVALAKDGADAHRELAETDFAAAILDINLPDTDGLQLLQEVKEQNPDAVVVLVTGFASLETAMEAVHLGAYEYVRKPFGTVDLVHIVERGLESQRLKGRNDELLSELQATNENLVAQQEHMREQMRIASEDLTAFVELGRRLSETSDLSETLQSILKAGLQLTRARAAAAYRIDRDADVLRGVSTVGLATRDVVGVELPLNSGLLGSAASANAPQIENDMLAAPIADDEHLGFLGIQSVLANPLTWDGTVYGVMALFDQTEGGFSEESLDLVQVLAAQAARVVGTMPEEPEQQPASTDEDDFVDLADLV